MLSFTVSTRMLIAFSFRILAESAFHPAAENNRYELYLMCHDLQAEMAAVRAKGVECREVTEARWGSITKFGYQAEVRLDYMSASTHGQ